MLDVRSGIQLVLEFWWRRRRWWRAGGWPVPSHEHSGLSPLEMGVVIGRFPAGKITRTT